MTMMASAALPFTAPQPGSTRWHLLVSVTGLETNTQSSPCDIIHAVVHDVDAWR